MTSRLLALLLVLTTALPGLVLAEAGDIVLKINVVNPSQKEPQIVAVKVFLPKEATPKDVKELGDLKLAYDPESATYYVHGDVMLEAGQTITKMVTIEDIWTFKEEQLLSLVNEAKERASKVTDPAAAKEAAAMVRKIEQKVEEIVKRQEETEGKPAERIQAYRQGLTTITTIEADLEKLGEKGPLRDGKGLRDPRQGDSRIPLVSGDTEGAGSLGRSLSMTTAWRLILGILAFLGILSAIFFLTWQRLLKVTVVSEGQATPLVQGDSTS